MWFASIILFSVQAEPITDTAPSVYEQRLQAQLSDDACDLFTATERALLDAAIKRSRDDAVLQGASPEQLDPFETAFANQFTADCNTAFSSTAVIAHQTEIETLSAFDQAQFQGRYQNWISIHGGGDDTQAQWRVIQVTGQGSAHFGIFQDGEDVGLALAARADLRPAYAIAFIRDSKQEPYPVDLTAGGLLPPPGDNPVSIWGAPSDRQSRIFATHALSVEHAAQLAPAEGAPAIGFKFPDDMVAQMTQLEPREAIQIDLFDSTSAPIARYWIEVGAFDAALAFLQLPLRETEAVALTSAQAQ